MLSCLLVLLTVIVMLFSPPIVSETGLEYVHGAIVWLCVLTLYMLCTHLARRKVSTVLLKSYPVLPCYMCVISDRYVMTLACVVLGWWMGGWGLHEGCAQCYDLS